VPFLALNNVFLILFALLLIFIQFREETKRERNKRKIGRKETLKGSKKRGFSGTHKTG
jgi:hypothetical protein